MLINPAKYKFASINIIKQEIATKRLFSGLTLLTISFQILFLDEQH
jgi:hypothetical protein